MDDSALNQRLSKISTVWTLLQRAHSESSESQAAKEALLERYQRAIYRYLLLAVRHDANAADDLFQECALRLVRGDFKSADPSRGRFRDFVKTALINLVINHHKKRARDHQLDRGDPEALAAQPAPDDPERDFLQCWRKELLDRAWEQLAGQQDADGPPFFSVLRERCEHPEVSSEQLAERLTAELKPGQPYTDVGIRKTLQRAREKFTELLLDEVAHSLQTSDPAALEQELAELGFMAYCRKPLERRKAQRGQ